MWGWFLPHNSANQPNFIGPSWASLPDLHPDKSFRTAKVTISRIKSHPSGGRAQSSVFTSRVCSGARPAPRCPTPAGVAAAPHPALGPRVCSPCSPALWPECVPLLHQWSQVSPGERGWLHTSPRPLLETTVRSGLPASYDGSAIMKSLLSG